MKNSSRAAPGGRCSGLEASIPTKSGFESLATLHHTWGKWPTPSHLPQCPSTSIVSLPALEHSPLLPTPSLPFDRTGSNVAVPAFPHQLLTFLVGLPSRDRHSMSLLDGDDT